MQHFTSVYDLPNLGEAVKTAREIKLDPYCYRHLGKNKTMILIFFDASLRTRLSTQKAAMNLGLDTVVLNVNQDGWRLETEMGVVMDGDKAEHLREAVPVIGRYCDIIGVRAFARFESKEDDYSEKILNQFIQYAGVPIVSMEAATRHPLQSFADHMTIEEYKTKARPKVVLSWAPHPRALPQAVPNSFVEWMRQTDYDLVVTHPEGYELDPKFMGDLKVEYNQDKALAGADFVYAKNWSSYLEYGEILSKDRNWTITADKMALTDQAKFMHCLPVRRNMIVTDEVLDGPSSIVIDEAENRIYSAQAVLKMILER